MNIHDKAAGLAAGTGVVVWSSNEEAGDATRLMRPKK